MLRIKNNRHTRLFFYSHLDDSVDSPDIKNTGVRTVLRYTSVETTVPMKAKAPA